jgi:hypothetical protein
MRKTLIASKHLFFRKIAILTCLVIALMANICLWWVNESLVYISGVIILPFLIRWSYKDARTAKLLQLAQFQVLHIDEAHFSFEHLPKKAGEQIVLNVIHGNIKSIRIRGARLYVLVARHQNWIGLGQEIFIPVGTVPKMQVFALPYNRAKRALYIHELQTLGFRIIRR